MQNCIQLLPAHQISLKEEIKELNKKVSKEKESIDFFKSMNTGSRKELLKTAKSQLRDLKATLKLATWLSYLDINRANVNKEMKEVDAKIKALEGELSEMKATVKQLKKAKASHLYILIHLY